MRILLTGISGFIGGHLATRLSADGHAVIGVVRRGAVMPGLAALRGLSLVRIGDLAGDTDWAAHLRGVDAVVHLAARVHVMRETAADPLQQFRAVNVEGTRRLAEAAAAAGVGRFVYLSTIKVNGEHTAERPFTAADPPAPQGPYAVSKYEAEQALHAICARSPMQAVVIRPPLVYGPGVKGNLGRLLRLVARGVPLPLGGVANHRSMVSLANLADLIATCLVHPGAAGQTFLVADGQDWSTPGLIAAIAAAMHRPPRLFRVPVWLLKTAAGLLGRGAVLDRLCDSLQVDTRKNLALLGWQPPQPAEVALRLTVEDFVAGRRDA